MSEQPAEARASSPSSCPRIEPIAALLDRQLRGHERQELLDHLAACEACYGIFAATSQVLSTEIQGNLAADRSRVLRRRILGAAPIAVIVGLALWQAARFARRPVETPAAELAQSLGATGRAVPIARRAGVAADAVNAAVHSPGVAFGRAELRLAVAQLERRPAEAVEAARNLASLAGLSPNAATPRGLSLRDSYSRIAADLERGFFASTAPLDGAGILFSPREVAGGRCLEAAEYAAGGGAWFGTDTGHRCRAAVARLGMAGVDSLLAAWPEDGAPDPLALANALSEVGVNDAGNGPP